MRNPAFVAPEIPSHEWDGTHESAMQQPDPLEVADTFERNPPYELTPKGRQLLAQLRNRGRCPCGRMAASDCAGECAA